MNEATAAAAETPGPHRALVLISHGGTARVRLEDGSEQHARAAGREQQFVCGDEVLCTHDARHDQWQIASVAARRSVLHRTNARGRPELVAANLTLLVVVLAPLPEPDLFVVDRYLAAAQCAGIAALLLAAKSDLGYDAGIVAELAALAATGCEVQYCSALSGFGLDGLHRRLSGERVMLVGQSGVGKSSLLRALVPGSDALVGELLRNDEGRHTTSAAHLYDLPGGGALIDSPGVRDFAPAIEQLEPRSLGFADIARLAAGCRFADCAHLQEPGCAVRAALAAGQMSERRYESYRRLRRLRSQLQERAPRGRR